MSKKQVIAALAIVGVVAAIAVVALSYESPASMNLHKKISTRMTEEEREFINFIAKYRKNYFNREEYEYRLQQFAANYQKVQAHNAADMGYSMAINEFADLHPAEFKKMYTGLIQRRRPGTNYQKNLKTVNLPTSVNWVTAGDVTGVKNQGQCGSCWSFSTTGAIESITKIKTGKLVSLSEQQLVDCSGSYGNMGCNGGLMDNAFKYVEANGLCSEADYPYTARDGTCKASSCTPVIKKGEITGFYDVPQGSTTSMKAAVAQQPTSIAIEADQYAFQMYSGGVLKSGCGTNLDHGVLCVGYGTENGVEYWLVKNSWGSSWGSNGYIKIGIAGDQCGVELSASYPKE